MKGLSEIKGFTIATNDVYKEVFLLPIERRGFSVEQSVLNIPTFFCRVIGFEDNTEEEYYNDLFHLHKKLKDTNLYLHIDFHLDTFVPPELINRINLIWGEIKADTNLRAGFIANNFYGSTILKITKNELLDHTIKSAFEACLQSFITSQNQGKNANITRNFCIKMVYWIMKYAHPVFTPPDESKHCPKCMFYGEIKRDEVYFLMLLSKLGFDVLYFNSETEKFFDEIDPNNHLGTKLVFTKKIPLKPFPKEEKQVVIETNAYRAEKNAESALEAENISIIRRWQFENYPVKSVVMKTTYEEIFTYWESDAKDRFGFKVVNKQVFIPNIFAKINGTHQNIASYWSDFSKLLKEKNEAMIIFDRLPFTRLASKSLDYRQFITSNGIFDIERIKISSEYKLSFLKAAIQNLILDKANELVKLSYFNFTLDINMKIKILATLLNMDIEILKLLQKFDYPYFIPKVIIFHNDNNTFSHEDAITLAFLNAVGLDVVIFTPTGYNNIENSIKRELFDTHSLETVNFDLNYSREVAREVKRRQPGSSTSIFNIFKFLN